MRTGFLTTHRHVEDEASEAQGKALKRRSLECVGGVVNREGSGEVIRGLQFDQGPGERNVCLWSDRDQGRRKLRADFDIEAVQRQIQPKAYALQQRFFAGPAAKKSVKPLRSRKIVEGTQFARRKMMRSDVRVDGANHFDVDTKRVIAADCKGGEAGTVGQVEVNRRRSRISLDLRLSAGIAGKGNLVGGDGSVLAQQDAQGGMGAHVAIAILGEYQAARAGGFFFAEDIPVGTTRGAIQVPGPNVDTVVVESGSGVRLRPGVNLCSHPNFLLPRGYGQLSQSRPRFVTAGSLQFQISEKTPTPIGSKR